MMPVYTIFVQMFLKHSMNLYHALNYVRMFSPLPVGGNPLKINWCEGWDLSISDFECLFVSGNVLSSHSWPSSSSSALSAGNLRLSSHYPQSDLVYSGELPAASSCQCPHCPVVLVSAAFLKAHISESHGNAMPYMCSLCGKGYLSSAGLHLHKLLHQGKSFDCPVCDMKFSQKSNLKRHLARVHSLAVCLTCSNMFSLGLEYNQHVLHCQQWKRTSTQTS